MRITILFILFYSRCWLVRTRSECSMFMLMSYTSCTHSEEDTYHKVESGKNTTHKRHCYRSTFYCLCDSACFQRVLLRAYSCCFSIGRSRRRWADGTDDDQLIASITGIRRVKTIVAATGATAANKRCVQDAVATEWKISWLLLMFSFTWFTRSLQNTSIIQTENQLYHSGTRIRQQ